MAQVLFWLASFLRTWPATVLGSMGIGWLSFEGYKAAVLAFSNTASASVNSMTGTTYQIADMAGFIDAFGIILSAIVGRAAIVGLDRLARIVK